MINKRDGSSSTGETRFMFNEPSETADRSPLRTRSRAKSRVSLWSCWRHRNPFWTWLWLRPREPAIGFSLPPASITTPCLLHSDTFDRRPFFRVCFEFRLLNFRFLFSYLFIRKTTALLIGKLELQVIIRFRWWFLLDFLMFDSFVDYLFRFVTSARSRYYIRCCSRFLSIAGSV